MSFLFKIILMSIYLFNYVNDDFNEYIYLFMLMMILMSIFV